MEEVEYAKMTDVDPVEKRPEFQGGAEG